MPARLKQNKINNKCCKNYLFYFILFYDKYADGITVEKCRRGVHILATK